MLFRFAVHLYWVAALICLLAPGRAAQDITPPFDLAWGEASERVGRKLDAAKATVVERRRGDVGGGEAWHVEGIKQPGLKRAVFYFRAAGLTGVELQYSKDEWAQKEYDEYMGRWRRLLDQRFGPGPLIARKTEPNGDVTQTVVGWKWNQNNAAIELFYYAAEKGTQKFRTLSVHYKIQ